MTVTGVDHFGRSWPQTGEFYEGEAPDYMPPGEDQPPIEPGSYPPNPSRTSTLLGWFAGSHGDVFDQTVNFASGFGDNVTFGATKAMRQWHGMDYVDQDSWAYTGGDFAANFVPGPTAIAKEGTWAYKLYNKFDDLGGCANFFTKVIQGGCFVPGTLVTLSEMPRDAAFDAALWGNDELSQEPSCLGRSSNFQWLDDGSEPAPSSETTAVKSTRTLQLPIEQVPLGARVPTKNPKPWERDESLPEPDETTWVVVSLTVERSDGGVVDAKLMRPRTWVEQHGIDVGQLLPLNIEELQVQGLAQVTSIEPATRIASGDGSVITGRFVTRRVDVIARIEVLGADGQIDTIEGTTIHPIWSLDRKDWVPLSEIEAGDHLLGAAGEATVLTHIILQRATPVYNIEVHGEHVYEVCVFGLVVHNACNEWNAFQQMYKGQLGSSSEAAAVWRAWSKGTFPTKLDSIIYHFGKHGNGRTLTQYTDDAISFLRTNSSAASWGVWNPNWAASFKLKIPPQGGYFDSLGRILTYWD